MAQRWILGLLAAALLTQPGRATERTLLIANPSVGADSIGEEELRRVYQGTTRRLAGVHLQLTLLIGGPTHEAFSREFLSKSPQQVHTHWRRLVFSGKSRMPRAFETEQELVTYVARTPGAIGYIDASTPHDGVKVLRVR